MVLMILLDVRVQNKGIGSFLVRMTNIEEVQLFELILNLGKNGGQICKANFLCSLTFTK